jgi:DNA (cytosine-5)-methyltransferase 1
MTVEKRLTFIDLFSGIGGFRIALENLGAECVFSSDTDVWANKTYFDNFGEIPQGDISRIDSSDIPDHNLLCAGFPCQPFSIAGQRKGFFDTRGTLFFEIERILRDKSPDAFILENVRGLVNHDKGRTFNTIKTKLKELNYNIYYKLLNSKDFGLAQNRERIFIVGLKKGDGFKFPEGLGKQTLLKTILETNVKKHEISDIAQEHIMNHYNKLIKRKKINKKVTLIATEVRPSRCVFRNDGLSPCLTAKMGTGGNNVPIILKEKRKLTVRECLRLQGFPETFKMRNNYSQSYKQIGNSVSVPVVQAICENVINHL